MVRIAAADRFEVVSAPCPRLRAEGEVLVRTAVSGICSGDLMPWYLHKKVGTVLGHEVVGWAEEIGPGVTHIRPGDLVFMHHHAPCLSCPECQRGAHVHCSTWKSSHLDPGGMAEWVRVPAVNTRVDSFAVNDLDPEQAVFIEPLACCVKAFRRLPPVDGQTGVIVGCGVMGLLNLAVARALGAERLIAVDPDPMRRRLAEEIGNCQALTPDEAGTKLAQAAEFVVVGPGQPAVIQQSLAHVRPGGTVSLFTPTATGVTTALDLGELYFREVSLVPSYSCGPEDTREAYSLLRQGKVPTGKLVTHRFRVDDIQQAYETARGGGSALKVLVTFGERLQP